MKNKFIILLAVMWSVVSTPAYSALVLTDINRGTTANDGTGTTARAAGLIINNNNDAIEAAVNANTDDIAELEIDKAETTVTTNLQSQIDSLAAGGAYATSAFASLPSLPSGGVPTDKIYHVTDWDALFVNNVNYWKPVGGTVLIGHSQAAVNHTGSIVETSVATVPIPAHLMYLNGELEVHTMWSMVSSVNNKTIRIRFGGTGTNGDLYNNSVFTTSVLSLSYRTSIKNMNSASVQKGTIGVAGSSSAALISGTVNTATAQNLYINVLLANSGDSVTLESYKVLLHLY